MVWCWSDGDVVCRGCGLVAIGGIIDDRVCYGDRENYDVLHEPTPTSKLNGYCENEEERGHCASEICKDMGISQRKYWLSKHKDGPGGVVGSKSKTHDIIKRKVYECRHIESEKHWDVIKVARKFLDSMEAKCVTQTLKPDKLSISLIIIACEYLGLKVGRNVMCSEYGLTLTTLKKNEKLLQHCLV